MKALVKAAPEPGLELVELPVPQVGPNEVLIKVLRTGICGTDLHIDAWDPWARKTVPTPLIVGHEFCGEIVELGSAVEDLRVGQFVSGEGHYVCGRCRACLAGRRHLCRNTRGIGYMVPGCFCEYFAMPASNVWVHRVPVSPEVAAIFDPFGNAVHTALQFGCLGEDVLVSGAGPIGLMAALVVQFAGARNVIVSDLSEERLQLARSLGLKDTINPATTPLSAVFEGARMREGFDIGLEMSGSGRALADMIDNMTHGGRIALLGTPSRPGEIDVSKIIFNMLTLQGVTGRQIFETWYAMSVLLESGLDISGVITDVVPYTEHEQAFRIAANGRRGKVVMDWSK